MKKYYIFCFFLWVAVSFGQKPNIETANSLFKNKSYVSAVKMYETLPADKNTLQNLGDCYYYNFKMEKAVTTYEKLFQNHKDSITNKEYFFRYAQSLMGINDYDQADVWLTQYYMKPIVSSVFFDKLKKNVPYNYTIQLMDNEGGVGDFGLALYNEKVVFSSIRSTDKFKYSWNDQPYLDLYEATVTENNKLENIKPFSSAINSKTHESSVCFSKDGKTLFFSRTNPKRVKIGEEYVANVKIYKAIYKDNKWTDIIALPFTSDLYSTEHPSLSADEKKLYFSSDMPGTLGSMDIYEVLINEDGSFGEPTNLGSNINTLHREQFPFEASNGDLYFSSDGHQGFGGLDIFLTKKENNIFINPINIGQTLNSSLDDFGYLLKQDLIHGYFSSNRTGSDNLYSFKREKNTEGFLVEGQVIDKNTKTLLKGTEISLFDNQNKLIESTTVGENAFYSFKTNPNESYKLTAKKDFYVYFKKDILTNDFGKIFDKLELNMESFDDSEEIISVKNDEMLYINLENIYFDSNKWNIKPQAEKILNQLYLLLIKHPFMEVELSAHTDFIGNDQANLKLSINRANSVLEYLVNKGISKKRLLSEGFGENRPLIKCGNKCTKEENAINRRCDFIIIK